MFFGDFYPRMDDKGRIALPAKFRDRLSGGMVVAKGQDRCLSVYPRAEFERIAVSLNQAGVNNARVRNYARTLFGHADDQVADKQGRIVIKPALREFAGLSHECAVVGVNDRVEIWDAEAWRQFCAEQEQQFVDFSEDFVLPKEHSTARCGLRPPSALAHLPRCQVGGGRGPERAAHREPPVPHNAPPHPPSSSRRDPGEDRS